jgi:tripartite motif-containing protein 71
MGRPHFLRAWGGAGNQPGQFNNPAGLSYYPPGHLCVADFLNNRLQFFQTNGTPQGLPLLGFRFPYGIVADPNFVYVTNNAVGPNQLMSFPRPAGIPVPWATTGTDPTGVTTDGLGTVFVTVPNDPKAPGQVQVFKARKQVATWGPIGPAPGELAYSPLGIVFFENHVYVADTGNDRVQVFTAGGAFVRGWGVPGAGNGQFSGPRAIAADPRKRLIYVLDSGNFRVQVFTPLGRFRGVFAGFPPGPGNFSFLAGITISPDAFFVTNGFSVQAFTLF